MAITTNNEQAQIEQANRSGRTPVVFVHGLWLLPSSWDRWRDVFEDAGYTTLAPGWPDDPHTVAEAKAHPEVFAGQVDQRDRRPLRGRHRQLDSKPAVIGHSFGGLLTQILAGRGLSAASVAIDPAPFRGVLPLPISALKRRRRCCQPAEPRPGRAADLRAVPLRLRERRERGGGAGAVQHVRGPGAGRTAVPGGIRQPQPVDRGQGRQQNPERGPC